MHARMSNKTFTVTFIVSQESNKEMMIEVSLSKHMLSGQRTSHVCVSVICIINYVQCAHRVIEQSSHFS